MAGDGQRVPAEALPPRVTSPPDVAARPPSSRRSSGGPAPASQRHPVAAQARRAPNHSSTPSPPAPPGCPQGAPVDRVGAAGHLYHDVGRRRHSRQTPTPHPPKPLPPALLPWLLTCPGSSTPIGSRRPAVWDVGRGAAAGRSCGASRRVTARHVVGGPAAPAKAAARPAPHRTCRARRGAPRHKGPRRDGATRTRCAREQTSVCANKFI